MVANTLSSIFPTSVCKYVYSFFVAFIYLFYFCFLSLIVIDICKLVKITKLQHHFICLSNCKYMLYHMLLSISKQIRRKKRVYLHLVTDVCFCSFILCIYSCFELSVCLCCFACLHWNRWN